MRPYFFGFRAAYIAYFFGGVSLVNAVPHFVNGVSGRSSGNSVCLSAWQGTAFADGQRPMGNTQSNHRISACVPRRRVSHPHIPDVLVLGAGGLLMAVMLSRMFERLYGGK